MCSRTSIGAGRLCPIYPKDNHYNLLRCHFIISNGLTGSQLDHCMYISVIDSHTDIMAVFVDDILLASTCEDVTAHVKSLSLHSFVSRT